MNRDRTETVTFLPSSPVVADQVHLQNSVLKFCVIFIYSARISPLLPICGSQGMNLGHMTWWQVLLPAKTSPWLPPKGFLFFFLAVIYTSTAISWTLIQLVCLWFFVCANFQTSTSLDLAYLKNQPYINLGEHIHPAVFFSCDIVIKY